MPAWSFNQIITVIVILAGSLAAAFLAYFIMKKVVARIVSRTDTNLDNFLLKSLERPILLAIVVFGLEFAVQALMLSEPILKIIDVVIHSFFVVLLVYASAAVLQSVLKWYALEIASRIKTSLDDKTIPILRKATSLVAVFLAAIWILDIIGVDLPWIRNWLVQHGIRMALIIVLSMFLIFLLGRIIPTAIKPVVMQKAKEQPEEEIKKRVDTLSGVFVGLSLIHI